MGRLSTPGFIFPTSNDWDWKRLLEKDDDVEISEESICYS